MGVRGMGLNQPTHGAAGIVLDAFGDGYGNAGEPSQLTGDSGKGTRGHGQYDAFCLGDGFLKIFLQLPVRR